MAKKVVYDKLLRRLLSHDHGIAETRVIERIGGGGGSSAASGASAHADLTGVTSDQHHAQSHAIGGGDHSGSLAHTDLSDAPTDAHHAGFIALEDNAGTVISPAADDRIQITDDGIINADASGNTIALSIAQDQISHDSIGGVSSDDHHSQSHSLASHSSEAHSELTGVGTDDHHAQSHTVGSHSDATEGVQDIAGALVATGGTKTGIAITYQDATGDIDFVVDHDAADNFVANEHINHTSITLTAGVGLSGGGDISTNRTFTVDLNELTTETSIASGDFIAMVDITDSGSGKITFANLESTISHDNIAGVSANDHHAESHTLASHSAKAHSDLTGIGTGDHHTQAHDILHADHADSAAASVVRGDLVVGNSTPKFARFAIGADHTVLVSNGTDPSWSVAPPLANIADTGDTNRITLSTTSPEVVVTGDTDITGLLDAQKGLDLKTYFRSDDFTTGNTASGSVGELGWNLLSGTVISAGTVVSDHIGIRRVATANTGSSGGTTYGIFGATSSGANILDIGDNFEMEMVIKAINTARITIRVGFFNQDIATDPPKNGIYAEYINTAARSDSRWQSITRANNSETRNTLSSVAINSFVTLKIVRNGTDIEFYEDGSLIQTHSATVPTGSHNIGVQIIPENNNETRAMDIDYFSLLIKALDR